VVVLVRMPYALAWGVAGPVGALAVAEFVSRGKENAPAGVVLAMALAAAGCGYVGLRSAPGEAPIGRVSRVVVLGDSLAAGVAGDGIGRTWPVVLGEKLGADVVNLSFAGDTVDESMRRWSSQIASGNWKPEQPGWTPDLIIVELGGNDIRAGRGAASLESDLGRLVASLAGGQAKVLVIAVPGGIIGDEYKNVWSHVVSKHEGVHLMNQKTLRSMFGSPVYTLPDRIHFTQAGHDYFAEQVAARIDGGS
jgi:lysophospholipase L1-like esterase